MQLADRIEAIEARLRDINLTLWRLCKDAGVDYGTLHRWRTGKSTPLVTTLEQHLGALEGALRLHEATILTKLSKRKSLPASPLGA